MSDNKLKVGDTVIVKSCLYGHEFEIGQAVTIREIFEDANGVDYDCIGKTGTNWSLNEAEIGTALEVQAHELYLRLESVNGILKQLRDSLYIHHLNKVIDENEAILAAARGETTI